MQSNIDTAAQQKRRREAIRSAVASTMAMVLAAALPIGLPIYFKIGGLPGTLLLVLGVLELGMIVPVWIVLKIRLKEIEGGEENAATQY